MKFYDHTQDCLCARQAKQLSTSSFKKKLRELGGARVPLNNSGLELTLKQAGLCLCLLSAEINVSTTTPGLFSALLEYQVSCESTHGV